MNIRQLVDRVLFALSVPKCTYCRSKLDYGDKGLCRECSAVFKDFRTRNCSRCAKILNRCSCSSEFLSAHYVRKVVKCYRYLDRNEAAPGNSLIYSLKRDNRSDVLDACADLLCDAISNSVNNPSECIFINIPRRKSAIIKYGIDHSQLLAREIAKRFNARYIPLLASRAKRAQKSLESTDRFKNAQFYITRNVDLSNKRVIIIDDVITTGASIGKAASLVRSLGCKDITAATLSIAYKDNY